MPETLPKIPRWNNGPAGFLPKANDQLDAIERAIGAMPTPPRQIAGKRVTSPVLARVTAVAVFSGKTAQWVYTIELVRLTITASGGTPNTVVIEALDPPVTGKALNIAELANDHASTSTGVAFGIDMGGDDYPDGFAPRPISGAGDDNTHKQGVLVYVRDKIVASDGSEIYLIERMGVHDGTCDAPA